MRPPSYYSSGGGSGSSSSSMPPSGYRSNATSSQLRSTFGSSASSAYVTRTHLPFVSQSMLVAHCYTSSPSTASTRTSYTSYSSYAPSSSSYSSASSHYITSRPPSTKRLTGSTISSSSYSSPSSYSSTSGYGSSSYTSPSYRSSRTSTHSNYTASSSGYRRPSASNYYKPIRLRERPILTQISRQINASSSPTSFTYGTAHSESKTSATESEKKPDQENLRTNQRKSTPEDEETEWSHDLARNISRNKYLIKFREFDRRPTVSPESIDLVVPETNEVKSKEPTQVNKSSEPIEEKAQPEVADMRLPATKDILCSQESQCAQSAKSLEVLEAQTTSDCVKPDPAPKLKQKDSENLDCEKPEVTKVEKKKRNIKLKLKPLPGSAKVKSGEDATRKEPTAKKSPASPKVASPKVTPTSETPPELSAAGKPKLVKVKRVVNKASKSKADENSQGEIVKEAKESFATSAKEKNDQSETVKVTPKPARERKALGAKQEAPSVEPKSPATKKQNQSSAAKVAERKATKAKPEVEAESPKEVDRLAASAAVLPPSGNSEPGTPVGNKRIKFRDYHHEDFNFLSVLGHGGWGFVVLAELKEHDACFAVKCIKKITIVEDDDFESILIERKVLALGNIHPFICKLFCTFETEGYLFFVMEYCAGGDLMFHVQREGKFSESRCRFYAAEIICAIRFLHNRHIIYRDLKLDNILLDSKGHVRLVDFGMCQLRTYREEMLPSNFCGTPEYISPEIIKGVPYNHSVDWWSFGVLLYEMAVGKMPFRGNDENELLWNVCYEQIHYPMFLTRELTILLQQLMEREPTKRMGMATCKAGDIYDQPWFRGVDWAAVESQRVPPPFIPEVKSKRDVQNFDSDFTQSACELSPVDESVLRKIDQKLFQKFPYTNPEIGLFE